MTYFVPKVSTPVLNQADFQSVFGGVSGTLPFDQSNLVRAIEMIAFPGTVFEIVHEHLDHILQVRTAEYPTLNPLFVDRRFGTQKTKRPPEREKNLPAPKEILKRLKHQLGKPYIWGGNWGMGVPELLRYYPPKKILTPLESVSWTCQGVDCSGLLYEAVEGALPRNTQDLLFVGRPVPLEGVEWENIPSLLQPLDLIIWNGHMTIVYDNKSVIESKHEWGGVCMTDLQKRLRIIREEDKKIAADDPASVLQNRETFLVRRFLS
ncbi:C40 family peptidase [Simkania negevensis]|uniref:NlpC/P60 domain-containing protein n=1 Tax=Simkania negevensis (strain ATCC VR-1471 / DSM 27360 / Z) TaxID=331113 RepID=F8L4E2_SIMNZ|nr:C40 family peptidase [Simkania negevensis]CCB90193.1 putative uncharacterized protein [Simkania negevensis Z]